MAIKRVYSLQVAYLGEHQPGLRERKKQRTRAMLIDAAVELCLRQGYENTTVDQIAARADVSPRTFCRYFPSKEAVVMTLLDGLIDAVERELAAVPPEVPVLRALKDAHITVLRSVSSGGVPELTSDRIVLMLQIINSTPALKAAAAAFPSTAALSVLSERMGVPADHPRLRLVSATWASVIVTACGDLVSDGDGVQLGPELMADRIDEIWSEFSDLANELTGGVTVGAE
jgi:AcrR family transcriptional regulator